MKYCQWCDNLFQSNVSYQIYCSPECRSEATKQKIIERYQEKRRNNRKPRNCKSCGTQLSMYNDDQLCSNCEINPLDVSKVLKEIKGLSRKKDKD
jgi:ribosomal protein S14